MNLRPLLLVSALLLPSTFAQTVPLTAGRTSVALNPDTVALLGSLKVQLGVTGSGRLSNGTLSFPITVGNADANSLKAEILHAGGLTVTVGSTTLLLSNFTVDTTGETPELSALAIADGSVIGRVNVFDLKLPDGLAPPITPAGKALIDLGGIGVTLSADGAAALNQVFSVSVFAKGIPIGTARVQALVDVDAIQ
jgi:hypothetical protein